MRGKVCIITGASSGTGKAVATKLAEQQATVILACRHIERAEEVKALIKLKTNNDDIHALHLDLASLSSIREFVHSFNQQFARVDVLINNTSIINLNKEITEDGLERTFAVNFFGPFLLTHLLIDPLQRAKQGRIININSDAHYHGRLKLNDLNFERRFSAIQAYCASKLALQLFTQELASRLRQSTITVNSCQPGHSVINALPKLSKLFTVLGSTLRWSNAHNEQAANAVVQLAASRERQRSSGHYYRGNSICKFPVRKSQRVRMRLWQAAEQAVGLRTNETLPNHFNVKTTHSRHHDTINILQHA